MASMETEYTMGTLEQLQHIFSGFLRIPLKIDILLQLIKKLT